MTLPHYILEFYDESMVSLGRQVIQEEDEHGFYPVTRLARAKKLARQLIAKTMFENPAAYYVNLWDVIRGTDEPDFLAGPILSITRRQDKPIWGPKIMRPRTPS